MMWIVCVEKYTFHHVPSEVEGIFYASCTYVCVRI